jgi:hypothetical protein
MDIDMLERRSVLCLNDWISRESKTVKYLGNFNRSSHPTLKARRMTLPDVVQSIVFGAGMTSAVLWVLRASRP